MPTNTQNLYDERAQLIAEQRSVYDKADAEKRGLTGEEIAADDQRSARLDELDKQIQRREDLSARESRLNDKPAEWAATDSDEFIESRGLPLAAGQAKVGSLNEYRKSLLAPSVVDDEIYKRAFYKMLSTRDMREMSYEEQRTLSKATAAAGANLVPTDFERNLIEFLRDTGTMRQLARVITTQNGDTIQWPNVTAHGTATWLAENAAYSASDESFGQLSLSAYKAGSMIQVSEELLTDAFFDLEGYIRQEFADRIGVLENTAYVAGNGSNKPTGLTVGLSTTAWANGVSGGTITGATGTTTSVAADTLFDLFHGIFPAFRRNAVWLMNDQTVKALRKLKDTTNQYLWQPGLTVGAPDSVLGRPVYTDPDMPVMAANAYSVVFGDIARAYVIRDVGGIYIQRLVELYAGNGQVGFRVYHRTEGKVVNQQAAVMYRNSAT